MRKVFQTIMFLLLLTALISCKDNNSPDNGSNSGGTLKITASSGTTKTFLPDVELLKGVNVFSYDVTEPSSANNNAYSIELRGFCDAGEVGVYLGGVSSIQIGKMYSYIYKNKPVAGEAVIQLYDWIAEDFGGTGSTGRSVKVTVQFSKFQYPGQIKGIVINYDINDKVVAKGEFDFVSIKPKIQI